MIVHMTKTATGVTFTRRAEDVGTVGDAFLVLQPGEVFFGKTFKEWQELPEGKYEIRLNGVRLAT
jgi:hypothetical protein